MMCTTSFSSASEFTYLKKVDTQKDKQLVQMGDTLLKALYKNQNLAQLDASSLVILGQGKKSVISSLKKADLTIITKKSKGSEEEKAERRKKLAQIIAMMWKIYDIGRQQREDAKSASYKIIDPQGKLYKFLKDYVTFANKQEAVFAYDRDPKKNKSSHYKTVSPEGQWGIDIRFYATQASLDLLPYGKSHLLFGKLVIAPNQPPVVFIKFEEFGIAAPSETIAHGINFLKAQLRSAAEKAASRVENNIRPEIIQEYLAIVSQLSTQDQAKFNTDKAETVREILLTVNEIAKARPNFKNAQMHLMKTLNTLYPNDKEKIWYRTGDEIILDLSSLS